MCLSVYSTCDVMVRPSILCYFIHLSFQYEQKLSFALSHIQTNHTPNNLLNYVPHRHNSSPLMAPLRQTMNNQKWSTTTTTTTKLWMIQCNLYGTLHSLHLLTARVAHTHNENKLRMVPLVIVNLLRAHATS